MLFCECEAFSPLRGTNSETSPPVIFVCLNTSEASFLELLRLITLRGSKKCFFWPLNGMTSTLALLSGIPRMGAVQLIQIISFEQMQKFNESLMATLLYLLTSPETRLYVRSDVGLEVYCVAHLNWTILYLHKVMLHDINFECDYDHSSITYIQLYCLTGQFVWTGTCIYDTVTLPYCF